MGIRNNDAARSAEDRTDGEVLHVSPTLQLEDDIMALDDHDHDTDSTVGCVVMMEWIELRIAKNGPMSNSDLDIE